MVVGEQGITQAVDTIRLIINVLPVGFESRGSRRVTSKQEGIQLIHDFLIHAGLKFACKERGPSCLLKETKNKTKQEVEEDGERRCTNFWKEWRGQQ